MHKIRHSAVGAVNTAGFGESVETGSRRPKNLNQLSQTTKARVDSIFPEGFLPRDYANALLLNCAKTDESVRALEIDATIDKLVSLERISSSLADDVRVRFFRDAKRMFASSILENAVRRFSDHKYRKETSKSWSDWLFAKGISDMNDFWFWNGWRDRFFAEEHDQSFNIDS